MQLAENQAKFAELGIQVAVMTYEPPSTTINFSTLHNLQYPILYDQNAKHVLALGILNSDYAPDHVAYGIPNPGIRLIDANGVIRNKFFRSRYQDRPEFEQILDAARQL